MVKIITQLNIFQTFNQPVISFELNNKYTHRFHHVMGL